MSFKTSSPDDPTVIREIVPGVTTISVPFLRFGRIKFGGRATIVRLQSGTLAVFSPTPLTPLVRSTLSKLSSSSTPVSYLIAPDMEHHMNLSAWHAAFPSSHVMGPEGLPEKRAQAHASNPDVTLVPFSTIFTAAAGQAASKMVSPEFDAEFEYEYVAAHPNKEIVFFHRPSKTLIQADLLFNLPATEQYSRSGLDPTTGWATKLAAGLQNTRGAATWQKRVLWYVFSQSDREGFGQSMRRINGWGFENLVPCHGDTLVGDGKGVFEKVMQWHLEGKK